MGNLNKNHVIVPGNTEGEGKVYLGQRRKVLWKLQTSNSTHSLE